MSAAPITHTLSQQRLAQVKELWTRSQKDQLEIGHLLYQEREERLGVGGRGDRDGFHQWLREAGIPKTSAYRRIAEYEVSIGIRVDEDKPEKPVPSGTTILQQAIGREGKETLYQMRAAIDARLKPQREVAPDGHHVDLQATEMGTSLRADAEETGLPRRWHKYEREDRNGGCTLPDLRARINDVAQHFDDPFAFLGLTKEHKVPTGETQAKALRTRQTLDIPAQWKTPDGELHGTTNAQYSNGQLLNRLIDAVENGETGLKKRKPENRAPVVELKEGMLIRWNGVVYQVGTEEDNDIDVVTDSDIDDENMLTIIAWETFNLSSATGVEA